MKKVILSIALAMMSVGAMFAQSEEFKYGLGNRIGIGVGAGTEGIGVDVSTCFNKYFGVRAGLNFMPDIKSRQMLILSQMLLVFLHLVAMTQL